MKQISTRYLLGCVTGGLLLSISWGAQAATLEEVATQLSQTIGDRVEASAILGGNESASGGLYKFNASDADVNTFKLSGRGDLSDPIPLGTGDLAWSPVLGGSIGRIESTNNLKNSLLAGNKVQNNSFFLSLGGGGRLWFTKEWSASASVALLYTHFTNTFTATNAAGVSAKELATGKLVDWNADTLSVVPTTDIRYRVDLTRDLVFEFTSSYSHFATWGLHATTSYIDLEGSSDTWSNKIDLDQRLPWKLFDQPLHTGGYFSRMDLFGGAARGFNTEYMYTGNVRLVVGDLPGIWKAWFVDWLGLGGAYFWCDAFSGWSYGIDARLKF